MLDEFGLLASPKGHISGWERIGSGQIRYAINPGFDPKSSSAIMEYDSLLTKHREAVRRLSAKRVALEQAMARELWESA